MGVETHGVVCDRCSRTMRPIPGIVDHAICGGCALALIEGRGSRSAVAEAVRGIIRRLSNVRKMFAALRRAGVA